MELYHQWLRRNEVVVQRVEESLRTLIMFMPGRFGEGEVRSEALYSFVNLLGAYHDRVLHRPRAEFQLSTVAKGHTATVLGVLLTVAQHTEVLAEMVATHRNDGSHWPVVAAVESVKAIGRLGLLAANGGAMLVWGFPVPGDDHATQIPPVQAQAAAGLLPDTMAGRDLMQMYAQHGRGLHHPHGHFTPFSRPVPPSTLAYVFLFLFIYG